MKKSTKKSLLFSVLALVLCVAMLASTTLAWFTDSVSSGVNTIQAGNLDIEVEYKKLNDDGTISDTWETIQDKQSLFSSNLWEPGHTEVVYLKVHNAGSLALKYKVLVSPVSENGGINVYGQSFKLSDYLNFGTTTPGNFTAFADRTAARNAATLTNLREAQDNLTQEKMILAGAADQCMALVVYMPENFGNEANYKTGTTAPTINLGIQVVATQVENESDSFDNTYDKDAVNAPFYAGVGAYYDYFAAVNETATAADDGSFTVTKTGGSTGIIASASGTATAGANVNLVVTKTSVPTGNFGITVNEGEELNGYDIKVTGQTENSLVQGQLYVGTGLQGFKFYHNSAAMTLGTKGSLADGQYYYDSTDGFVYFATTTFSPFQATYKAPAAAITNGSGTAVYGTLADAIKAAKSGDTVVMLKDVELAGDINLPEGVTLDGVGHVVKKTSGNKVLINRKDVTIKNLIIDAAETQMSNWQDVPIKIEGKNLNTVIDGCTLIGGKTTSAMMWHDEMILTVRNCTFKNFERGFYSCGDVTEPGKMIFTGNTFTNVRVPIDGYWGKNKTEATDIQITGNTFNGGSWGAAYIQLWDYAQYANYCSWSNNTEAGTALKATVSDNTCVGDVVLYLTHCDWFAASDVTVSNNGSMRTQRRYLVEVEGLPEGATATLKNLDGSDITAFNEHPTVLDKGVNASKKAIYATSSGDYLLEVTKDGVTTSYQMTIRDFGTETHATQRFTIPQEALGDIVVTVDGVATAFNVADYEEEVAQWNAGTYTTPLGYRISKHHGTFNAEYITLCHAFWHSAYQREGVTSTIVLNKDFATTGRSYANIFSSDEGGSYDVEYVENIPNVVLDLNGHSIAFCSDNSFKTNSYIEFYNANLTIKDSVGTGAISGKYNSVIYPRGNGKLTIEGGTITTDCIITYPTNGTQSHGVGVTIFDTLVETPAGDDHLESTIELKGGTLSFDYIAQKGGTPENPTTVAQWYNRPSEYDGYPEDTPVGIFFYIKDGQIPAGYTCTDNHDGTFTVVSA